MQPMRCSAVAHILLGGAAVAAHVDALYGAKHRLLQAVAPAVHTLEFRRGSVELAGKSCTTVPQFLAACDPAVLRCIMLRCQELPPRRVLTALRIFPALHELELHGVRLQRSALAVLQHLPQLRWWVGFIRVGWRACCSAQLLCWAVWWGAYKLLFSCPAAAAALMPPLPFPPPAPSLHFCAYHAFPDGLLDAVLSLKALNKLGLVCNEALPSDCGRLTELTALTALTLMQARLLACACPVTVWVCAVPAGCCRPCPAGAFCGRAEHHPAQGMACCTSSELPLPVCALAGARGLGSTLARHLSRPGSVPV